MSEPITNLPDAVAALGALPMPMGPNLPPFPLAPLSYEQKLEQEVARLQGLLAEATLRMHGARRERDLIRERVSEPFGCTHCGVAQRSHGRRYLGGVGMHAWERPSDEQVKDRMLARRAARMPLVVEGLRARVAELEAERHTTNEALSQAAETLRANRDRIAEHDAQREALAERLRAGQRWQRGRRPELVSQDFVSQSELRNIFGIPLVAPWADDSPAESGGAR